MSVIARLKFTQGMSTAPAGQALIGVLTTPVTVSNGNNSDVESWEYELLDVPPDSAVPKGVVTNGKTSSFTFAPDARGGYLFRLTVTDVNGLVSEDYRVFQIAETSGRIIPPWAATGDALNFSGETRGWAPIMEAWFAAIDSGGGGGGGAVIFDGADALRSTRADQSPVDTAKDGITNFSSGSFTLGATGYYSTISGGLNNTITTDYGTIAGGFANVLDATSTYGFAVGFQNRVGAAAGMVSGLNGNSSQIGQRVLGGGVFTAPPSTLGGIQSSELLVAAENPGGVGINLSFSGDAAAYPQLNEPNKAYSVTIDAVATAQGVGGANISKMWKKVALVRTDGTGVLSIVDDVDVIVALGDVGAFAWTLDFILGGASPFNLTCAFGSDVAARCVAKMSLVEVVHN